jgi:hypothetical protein
VALCSSTSLALPWQYRTNIKEKEKGKENWERIEKEYN